MRAMSCAHRHLTAGGAHQARSPSGTRSSRHHPGPAGTGSHCHQRSAVPVASPTGRTGPNRSAGKRNWDYRFTWIRDAVPSPCTPADGPGLHRRRGQGLSSAGCTTGWSAVWRGRVGPAQDHVPRRRLVRPRRGDARPLRGVPGLAAGAHRQRRRRPAPARHLRRSHEVHLLRRPAWGRHSVHQSWTVLAFAFDWLRKHGDQPDEGVWETRGGRQDFVYGLLNCLGRRSTEPSAWPLSRGRPGNVTRWITERDHVYNQIMTKGGGTRRSAFSPSTTAVTCSTPRCCCMVHVLGFVEPSRPPVAVDPRRHGARARVRQPRLPLQPLGLAGRAPQGDEGTFSLCTFWYVEALARLVGWTTPASLFEKMHTYANHLGLYSEEIGLHRRAAGQLPPGLHPSGPDRRRGEPGLPARPGRRAGGASPAATVGGSHACGGWLIPGTRGSSRRAGSLRCRGCDRLSGRPC